MTFKLVKLFSLSKLQLHPIKGSGARSLKP